jgi:hypothetical protein
MNDKDNNTKDMDNNASNVNKDVSNVAFNVSDIDPGMSFLNINHASTHNLSSRPHCFHP